LRLRFLWAPCGRDAASGEVVKQIMAKTAANGNEIPLQ
jgi:hypothetical protein